VDLAWRPPADGPAGAWGRALGGTVRGRTRLEAKARRSQDRTDLELSWDARDLEYVTAGENRRRKAAGVPLNLVLSGQLTEKDGRIQQAVLRRATLEVGGSQVSLVGRMGFAADGGASGGWGGMGLKDFDASADVQCVLDDSLKAFVPELVDLIGRHGLSGQVGATIRMAGDSASASLEATVDADRLAAGEIGPFDWGGKANLGPFRKPAGMTAFLKLEATVPSDLATMQVNNLRVRLDDLHLLAGGSAALRDADGRRTLRPRSAHAAVWTKRVEDLPRLVPELQPYALAGDAILEMEWKDGSEGRIEYVTFSTTGLSGRLGGKDVRMSGQIVLEGLRRTEAGLWELGRMAADGLELQAGNNRVWVVADVKDLPAAPKGTFHLLAEALDGRDLSEWLSPGPASGADKGKRRSKLLREETEALQKRAEKVLADLRPHLLSAGLTGRISIGELTTLDETVGQSIVARNVEAICAVDNGHLTVQYVAGLYGGCLRTKLDVHLADAIPLLAQERELQDVIATDPMQVQLARYFPGNRVNGAFNRQEKTTAALRDVVANTLDSRYVLHPEGESVTVTLDGVVTGRAAPVFVTRLLPGLNLATYSYKRMTGFATYRQNGTAVNDMVFDGYAYDMYMEGTTSTDNIGEYEVGVILLGTPQSAEFNHVYRQGRIPILKVKARIENGRMYDQEVTYPLPTETAYVIFLKNNVFYRIWLASKQK